MIATSLPLHHSSRKSEPDTSADECDSSPSCPAKPLSVLTELTPPPCSRPQKMKSSLCKNYMQQGYCPYASKCQFAHGPQQLRCNAMSNTSYKTKECFSYLNKGFCPYGRRCNFIHPRSTERPLLLQQIINQIPEMALLMHGPTSRLMPRLAHSQAQ